MPRFLAVLRFTLEWEAGFTIDHAGPTMAGILQPTYDRARRRWGLPTRGVRQSTPAERTRIYREDFWGLESWRGGKRHTCAEVPAPADLAVFDAAVNSGVPWGVKFLQRAVGAKDDGWFGDKTLALVKRETPRALAVAVTRERMRYVSRAMQRNRSLREYAAGWTMRWADVLEEAFA